MDKTRRLWCAHNSGSTNQNNGGVMPIAPRRCRCRKVAAAICVAAGAGLSASPALAGEVIGPPGTPGVPGTAQPDLSTAAPFHSNSICAYNGLNDLVVGQGQITYRTQTPANSGAPPGAPGAGPGGQALGATPGSPTCGGGSNFTVP